MSKHIKLALAAAAVSAAFAGPASADTIYGAGASAIKASLINVVLGKYCTAGTINYYDNATAAAVSPAIPGGSVFRITCTQQAGTAFTAPVDVTYDTTGGSWKAFTAANPALLTKAQNPALNLNPVSTVPTAGGTTQAAYVMNVLGTNYTVNYTWGLTAANIPAGANVTFGLTDVETALFNASSINQPLVANSWTTGANTPIYTNDWSTGTEAAGFPTPVFGVVFGVAASPALYAALQTDQLAAGGPLAGSGCVAGTVSQLCAPLISKALYRSLASANFGQLNTNAAELFPRVVPANTAIEIARRDQGSGTQAGSNAFFENAGCAAGVETTDLLPALPSDGGGNWTVSYNATTTAALARINTPGGVPASNFVIGVVSAENDAKLVGGAGFLKIDGYYPSNTNAAAGVYSYVTEENLHCSATATGDSKQLCLQLDAAAPDPQSLLQYTGTGIVQLSASKFYNNNTSCAGWRAK